MSRGSRKAVQALTSLAGRGAGHLLLREGFPHLAVVAVHSVVFLNCGDAGGLRGDRAEPRPPQSPALTDYLVHRVVVVEGDESEAPLLAAAAVCHDLNDFDFAILAKIVSQMMLLCIFLDASHKDLLDCEVGSGSLRILQGGGEGAVGLGPPSSAWLS